MIRSMLRAATLIALFLACNPVLCVAAPEDGPAVEVRRAGEAVIVEASMIVHASIQDTWAVLTDYDHMARFFPNLESSRIVARSGRTIQVEQKGRMSFGPFSIPFESLREIELKPFNEIRSKALSGSLRRGTAITTLSREGTGTRIDYRSESVPSVWTPPGIGPRVVASETRAQFERLRNEIMRRKGG